MATTVIALRVTSLLLFAAPMLLLSLTGRGRGKSAEAHHSIVERLPVFANFAAVGSFFPLLILFGADPESRGVLAFAASGCLLAASGAAVIFRSRLELGAAWSLVAAAADNTGLVTTGPYRLIRHPIYLGFLMLTAGQALAFCSRPAFVVLLAGIAPTFLWRAYAEERVLASAFGERYAAYRKRTKLIVPYLL